MYSRGYNDAMFIRSVDLFVRNFVNVKYLDHSHDYRFTHSSLFKDNLHLNSSGADTFSVVISKVIRDVLTKSKCRN